MIDLKNVQHNTSKFLNSKINKLLNNRQQCECELNLKEGENCERALKWFSYSYKENEHQYLQSKYEELKDKVRQLMKNSSTDYYNNKYNYFEQIEKDLNRTFPNQKFYEKESDGYNQLRQVLYCFTIFDPQVGYVQGINFIAAGILFHSQEYLAFWILVSIFELFELRDIYLPSLPGLSKHTQIIEYLILEHLPKIHKQLIKNDVKIEMFTSPWIISFFGTILPLDIMGIFYDMMLAQGWPFFYKIILSYLMIYEHELLKGDQLEILTILTKNNYSKQKNINWFELIENTNLIDMDINLINNMLVHFDKEKKEFIFLNH